MKPVPDNVSDMRRVRFTPTPQDLVAAYRRHAYGRLWSRATLIALIVSLLIVAGFVRILMANAPWSAIVAVLAASLLGGLLFPLAMIRWQVPIAARRIYRQQRFLHEAIDLSWDESGLQATAANGHSRSAWSDFHRWREDQDTILMYYSDALFQFLPKRILSEEQIDELRSRAADAKVAGAGPASPGGLSG